MLGCEHQDRLENTDLTLCPSFPRRAAEERKNRGGLQSVHLRHGDGSGLLQAEGAAHPEAVKRNAQGGGSSLLLLHRTGNVLERKFEVF